MKLLPQETTLGFLPFLIRKKRHP